MSADVWPSTWVNGRKGITTDLNGVYFVDVIDSNPATKTVKVRTRPHEGKTDLGQPREFWVEAESLFPWQRAQATSIHAISCRRTRSMRFVPNKGIDRASLDSAAARYSSHTNPKTFKFSKPTSRFGVAFHLQDAHEGCALLRNLQRGRLHLCTL